MKQLNPRQFSSTEFSLFRRYLKEDDLRGFAGASGAFSAAFPAIDTLLLDEAPRPRAQIAKNPLLFPGKVEGGRWVTREEIMEAISLRTHREEFLRKIESSPETKKAVISILKELAKFRGGTR